MLQHGQQLLQCARTSRGSLWGSRIVPGSQGLSQVGAGQLGAKEAVEDHSV